MAQPLADKVVSCDRSRWIAVRLEQMVKWIQINVDELAVLVAPPLPLLAPDSVARHDFLREENSIEESRIKKALELFVTKLPSISYRPRPNTVSVRMQGLVNVAQTL